MSRISFFQLSFKEEFVEKEPKTIINRLIKSQYREKIPLLIVCNIEHYCNFSNKGSNSKKP